MIVTIDGPAGTGKTTVAKCVARKLGYDYFDTGAMYRAVTQQILQKNITLNDAEQLEHFLRNFHFEVRSVNEQKRYFVDDQDLTDLIRSAEVTNLVSEVSAHPSVRQLLVPIQQGFGKGKKVVFEGRDMGTVVFPQADVKVFLTARPAVRAERRYLELKGQNTPITEEEVMQRLLERDHLDSTRELSPLKQAEDAHLVDTSDLTLDEVIEHVLALIPV